MIRTIKTVAVAAVVMGSMAFATGAQASDCHQPRCYWKTIVVYQSVQKPCVSYVTKYDHCGKPYSVRVVTYKTIQVPVEKQIKVCY